MGPANKGTSMSNTLPTLRMPLTIRGGDSQLLVKVNIGAKSAISSKLTKLLSLSIDDTVLGQLIELLQEMDTLHLEQLRLLRKHQEVFQIGIQPVTVQQFMIAATYEGRTDVISYCCHAFNELLGELSIDEADKAFLRDWKLKAPTPVTLPGNAG